MPAYRFSVLADAFAVVRLPPQEPMPSWALEAEGLVSLTRTADELSIVCRDAVVPAGARAERGWVTIKLHGPFAFSQVGVLASFAVPLAQVGVSLFALSTFDTDYILVKASQLRPALAALEGAGHTLVG
jgi:hypothetical protein